MFKIMIVEDDMAIAKNIGKNLAKWGYETFISTNFQDIIKDFVEVEPNLMLLDVKLPFYNGFFWCQEIRRRSELPIIFISSSNDNLNMIMAMNMGADDYITKPFDMEVLIAKIQALLRRTYTFQNQSEIIEHNGITLLLSQESLIYEENKVDLTKNEFKILELLFQNKGVVVSKKKIMMKLWDSDLFVSDNTLIVNMTRLRKKLQDNGINDLIITKKGVGYSI